jgi:hypothetical protein
MPLDSVVVSAAVLHSSSGQAAEGLGLRLAQLRVFGQEALTFML